MPTFSAVNTAFTRVDSRVPIASSVVKMPTTSTGPHSTLTPPTWNDIGTCSPNSPSASPTYTPQNLAITAAASSISRIRSHPITQATPSPMVA